MLRLWLFLGNFPIFTIVKTRESPIQDFCILGLQPSSSAVALAEAEVLAFIPPVYNLRVT